jgi:hypothetical protein
MIQIIQLLEERNMAFAFCLNKNEVLVQAAFGLLFQSLEIGSESAVSREDSKLFGLVLERIEGDGEPGAADFRKILEAFVKGRFPRSQRKGSDASSKGAEGGSRQAKRAVKAAVGRLVGNSRTEKLSKVSSTVEGSKKPTFSISNSQSLAFNSSGGNVSYMQAPMFARSEPSLSPNAAALEYPQSIRSSLAGIESTRVNRNSQGKPTDWEQLLSNLDNNIYDSIYGGPSIPSLGDYSSNSEETPCSPNSLWNSLPDLNSTTQMNPPCSTVFGSDGGEDGYDATLVMDSQNQPSFTVAGLGSPAFLNSSNGVDMFEGLDFIAHVH